MAIDDNQMYEFMRDMNTGMGSLLEGQKNQAEHISAVSKKVDRVELKIDAHVPDIEAHGRKAEGKLSSSFIAWVGLGIGVMTFIITFLKLK